MKAPSPSPDDRLSSQPSREAVETVASGASEPELASRFVAALNQLAAGLSAPGIDTAANRESLRLLIAHLGDDLRMLREGWSGRLPSPPPVEGRPLQSRPGAPLSLLQRQAEAIAEGARMLVEETRKQGSASIPDAELGQLTQAEHLAAMILRVEAAGSQLGV